MCDTMLNMTICKNALCALLDASLEVVIDKQKKDLSSLFYDAIVKDELKYKFFETQLLIIQKILDEDIEFFMDSDPAASSQEEIRLAYPGFKAIAIYRISNFIYKLGFKVQARYISEVAHSMTGIDIHPAAEISWPFFIDHGTGTVIGETSKIGKRVKIYQCVTLGAVSLSNAKELRGVVRHPQVGNDVTIYAGASLLGAINIGNNVTIGSNVFLTEDVESNMKVMIGKPELIYKSK